MKVEGLIKEALRAATDDGLKLLRGGAAIEKLKHYRRTWVNGPASKTKKKS